MNGNRCVICNDRGWYSSGTIPTVKIDCPKCKPIVPEPSPIAPARAQPAAHRFACTNADPEQYVAGTLRFDGIDPTRIAAPDVPDASWPGVTVQRVLDPFTLIDDPVDWEAELRRASVMGAGNGIAYDDREDVDFEPTWHRRHDDVDSRKAVAVVGAFLLGISVGLLAMRAALDWGWLS